MKYKLYNENINKNGNIFNQILQNRGIKNPSKYLNLSKDSLQPYQNLENIEESIDIFDKHYIDVFTCETEGIRDLILSLKSRGYSILGLSNWSSRVYDVINKFDIFNLIEDSLISKDVHQLKPNKDIYESFLNKFDVKAAECVFIDDKPENIEGCKTVGMNGIVFKNSNQLKQELDKLLLSDI